MIVTKSDADDPIVSTQSGSIRGRKVSDRVLRFSNIPYARAPLGEFRFLAPAPAGEWEGVRDGREHGKSGVQARDEVEPNSLLPQSEDCLWLSVWTQGLDLQKRPVMVFIHGGGFIGGGAGADIYDGTQFSDRGDVVLVSIQYRLGILGWLDLEGLGGDLYRNSKNNGLLDQLQALRWIKQNIASFGGDPENITIFGESAGSSSVLSLMVMPAAKGLFQRVIGQSCTFDYHRTAERCRTTTERFLELTGFSTIEEVRDLTTARVLEIMTLLVDETTFLADWLFGPVFDGELLPADPYAYIREGKTAGISVMHGTTADEYKLWLLYYEEGIRKHPRKELGTFVQQITDITDHQLDGLIEVQSRCYPARSESDQYIDITNWMFFRYPHNRLSKALGPHAPVWQYYFAWQNPKQIELGAYHGIEMDFVFHLAQSDQFSGREPPTRLLGQVQDAWMSFARSGDPNHEGLPDWPAYQSGSSPTMILAEETRVRENLDPEMLRAFEALGIDYGF